MPSDPESSATSTLVVAFAGLPGTGKSTLARRLARRLGAPVLDKDRVREALLGPDHVTASAAENDHCCDLLYRTVHHLQARETPVVLLDGRTYTRRAHVEALLHATDRPGLRLAVIECRATPEEAVRRLTTDTTHAAPDRTPELHQRLAATADPLQVPHLTLDTTSTPLETLEHHCLTYLGVRAQGEGEGDGEKGQVRVTGEGEG